MTYNEADTRDYRQKLFSEWLNKTVNFAKLKSELGEVSFEKTLTKGACTIKLFTAVIVAVS